MSAWWRLVAMWLAVAACSPSPRVGSATEQAVMYTCGMHPQVVEHAPGSCPICGMDLTRLRGAGDASHDHDDALATVEVRPGVVQRMGVETARVDRTSVFRHLRTIGEVVVGEDEVVAVSPRLGGWIDRLRVGRVGDRVVRGQVLFDMYSPELVAAQDDLLASVGRDPVLEAAARRKLSLWGIHEDDVDAVVTAGVSRRALPVRSPSRGFVLHKGVMQGSSFKAGDEVFRIGRLDEVWVKAEVYEHDAPWLEVGQAAQMELSHQPGRLYDGEVSYVYPTLNARSRTLTVRLEFDNPELQLKPGMFATVNIEYRRQDDVIAVPTEAVLHSGRREFVFVAKAGGRFEARDVVTGLRGDHRMVEVRSGLDIGEEVVVNGQFLIDSESQLQEAIRKIVSGGEEQDAASSDSSEASGQGWSCPMHPEERGGEKDRCGLCGMFLERDEAAEVAPEASGQGWSCPMHPEERGGEKDRCSLCGMFLERDEAAEDAP